MNTVTAIEAERVVQIITNSIDRLQLLAHVPNVNDISHIANIDCPTVLYAIQRQYQAEDYLVEESRDDAMDVASRDIAKMKKMHRAIRATCRNMQSERGSLELLNRPETQNEEFVKFVKYLEELKGQVYSRMTTTVEDESANRSLLYDLTERERQAEESRDAIQNKLAEVKEEKDRVTYGLDRTLRKLQFELHDLTQQNKAEVEAVNKEMGEAIAKHTSDHEIRMKQLQDQLEGLGRNLNETTERNREDELKARRDKTRAEAALAAKIAQFDQDMEEKTAILEDLEKNLEEETTEYNVLKEYFDKVDADLNRERKEEQILDAVRRRNHVATFLYEHSVVLIQSMMRARKARQEVLKMKSKKGGKKGKGKKGKK
jgi:DNA repair exonuclease SbcCD ATPase subunit